MDEIKIFFAPYKEINKIGFEKKKAENALKAELKKGNKADKYKK